jgi:uncharacterized protein
MKYPSGRCVVGFLKIPKKGAVKTRLARNIGPDMAAHLYRQMFFKTTLLMSRSRFAYRVYLDRRDIEFENKWLREVRTHKQSGQDLGERMRNAFQEVFREGFESVVIVGSDCPYLEEGDIRRAFADMRAKDAVVGPTQDGGYYLIGLRSRSGRHLNRIFDHMKWSRRDVLAETRRRLQKLGITATTLRTLQDVDTSRDLKEPALRQMYGFEQTCKPRTI